MTKNLSVFNSSKIDVNKSAIHKIILLLKNEIGFELFSLQYNFVSPVDIQSINKKYLNHDFTTDIITFNYSGKNDILEGEVFISIQDALQNSKKFKVSLDNEILRLVIHGILHLIGYDDKKPTDKVKMKKEENRLVNLLTESFNGRITQYGS